MLFWKSLSIIFHGVSYDIIFSTKKIKIKLKKIMIILYKQRNSYIALSAHANSDKITYEIVVMKNETDIY